MLTLLWNNQYGRVETYADGGIMLFLLQYPDMTIRDFFAMASEEIREQEEELGYYE